MCAGLFHSFVLLSSLVLSELPFEEWQEACWTVIDAYFEEKGLVQQQLGSFNEFVGLTLQSIVKETTPIDIPAALLHNTNDAQMAVRVGKEEKKTLTSSFFFFLSWAWLHCSFVWGGGEEKRKKG